MIIGRAKANEKYTDKKDGIEDLLFWMVDVNAVKMAGS